MSARWTGAAALAALAVAMVPQHPLVAADAGEPWAFVVAGHLRGQGSGRLNPLVDEFVAEAARLRPEAVFLTGDLIWGFVHRLPNGRAVALADWEALDAKLARIGAPIYRVAGNHDVNDPITRDLFAERYGELPRTVEHRGSLFVLLDTNYTPDEQRDRTYMLTASLERKQIEFLREALAGSSHDHVFLLMHHVLWWDEDAPWWSEVHPLLAGTNVRAVFSGDYGPQKFSQMERDGVHYIRSAIEDRFSADRQGVIGLLRQSEENRLLAQQFDNFVVATVDGPRVRFEVRTLGALTSQKFTPERWLAVHGKADVDPQWVWDPERPPPGWLDRLRERVGGLRWLAWLAAAAALGFAAGALVMRRRRAS